MELAVQQLVDSPEHPGEQQLGEPGGQQLAGGPSPCQLGHGDEAGGQRRREGESRAWMAKAHVEGHVDTASSSGEVEGGISTS